MIIESFIHDFYSFTNNFIIKMTTSLMKIINKAGFIALIVLITNGACNTQRNKTTDTKINYLVDSLRSIYAPDKRVSLWNVSIVENSDKIRLIGEIDNERAYNDISDIIVKKHPNVETNIKLLPEKGDRQVVTGLINNSVANLRSNPSHSAEIATQALLGTPIRILKRENDWYLVQTPNKYIAWVDTPAVVRINQDELSDLKLSGKVVYNKQYGYSYSEPDDNSQTVSDLVIGCILPVTAANSGFYKVQYPDKRIAWVKKDEVVDAEEIFERKIDEKELVETAKKFVGFPYLWGGTSSKAVDCSGFTSMIYYMNGTVLQRDASQQTKYGKEITTDYEYRNLQPGDLLFFGRKASDSLSERVTHVAMYIGNTEFIHASGKVRINSIDSTRDNFIPEYVARFVRAVRVKGMKDGKGIEQLSENTFYKKIINNTE